MLDELRVSTVARKADFILAQYKSQNNSFAGFAAEESAHKDNPGYIFLIIECNFLRLYCYAAE